MVHFAADQQTITTFAGKAICRWEIATGVQTLLTNKSSCAPAFSVDGSRLVFAEGKDVVLWDINRGVKHLVLSGHTSDVRHLAFNPNGTRVASADGGNIKIWDAAMGKEQRTIAEANVGLVFYFSRNGEAVLTANGWDGYRGWKVADGTALKPGEAQPPVGVRVGSHGDDRNMVLSHGQCYSPNGKVLATYGEGWYMPNTNSPAIGQINLYDADAPGQVKRRLFGHGRGIDSVVFSQDGNRIASYSNSGGDLPQLRVWDITGRQESGSWPLEAEAVVFLPGGRVALCTGNAGVVRLHEPETNRKETVGVAIPDQRSAPSFTPDGRLLACVGVDESRPMTSRVTVWDCLAKRALPSLTVERDAESRFYHAPLFSRDGKLLALLERHNWTEPQRTRWRLWDVTTGKLLFTSHQNHEPWMGPRGSTTRELNAFSLAFSPDGKLVALGGDGMVLIWDVATQQVQSIFDGFRSSVGALAFSPAGDTLAVGTHRGELLLWETATGRRLWQSQAHSAPSASLLFIPRGERSLRGMACSRAFAGRARECCRRFACGTQVRARNGRPLTGRTGISASWCSLPTATIWWRPVLSSCATVRTSFRAR